MKHERVTVFIPKYPTSGAGARGLPEGRPMLPRATPPAAGSATSSARFGAEFMNSCRLTTLACALLTLTATAQPMPQDNRRFVHLSVTAPP